MPFVTTKEMFKKAYEGHYAVGAFNVNNMEIVQGIVDAAKEEESPLILQVSAGARKYAKHSYLLHLVEAAMEDTGLPIALHLDHEISHVAAGGSDRKSLRRSGGFHDDRAVRYREARSVALVLLVGDEHAVKPAAAQLLLYSLHVIHMPVSSDVGRGKVTMKGEPCGLFCPTAIEPPCALTASCTMLSPSPLPPASRERALSTR